MDLPCGNWLKVGDGSYVVGMVMVTFYFKGRNRWWKYPLTDMIEKNQRLNGHCVDQSQNCYKERELNADCGQKPSNSG